MKGLIIDCDPGVDDALALLLALLHPEAKVEAITTVTGNCPSEVGLFNALRVLNLIGRRDFPHVFKGAGAPLKREAIQEPSIHGEDGLGGVSLLKDPQGKLRYPALEPPVQSLSAHEAIIELLLANPHELTLVAIGPLTNLALAAIKDQEAMKKAKEVVIMGGSIREPGNQSPWAEFNFLFDPEAASVVLASGAPITIVPLDVTHKCLLPREVVHRKAQGNSSLARFIRDITDHYMDIHLESLGLDGCYMHDPLAVAVALDPSLVKKEFLHVVVECQGEYAQGMSLADLRPLPQEKKRPSNAHVCLEVDQERFLKLFLNTVYG